MPPKQPPFRAIARHAALAALLTACAHAPPSPPEVARADFARDHTCPARRVAATPVVSIAQPPHAIAHDPERRAMWNAAHRSSPIYAVEGCGEHADYKCWTEGGWVRGRRHARYETTMTVCLDETATR